jgi:hypothetical protein
MGWVFAVAFAAITLLALAGSGRMPRLALEISVAFILVGLAGYGWQGSPNMSEQTVSARQK